MHIKRWLSVLAFLLVFSLPQAAWAVQAQFPQPQGFVNDYANLLQPQERTQLERYLRAFRDSTGNEIAIAIFPKLPDDAALEDYVTRLYEAWGVGGRGRDNGVLIALFVQDRKVRIEVGYGLEPVIPDARAGEIYRTRMRPLFQQNRYYDGLATGVQLFARLAASEFNAPLAYRGRTDRANDRPNVGLALVIVLVIILVGWWFSRGGGGGTGGRRRRGSYGPGFFFLPTGWSGGSDSSWGGGGGLGDFGGFGGGMSGGGGASGDW